VNALLLSLASIDARRKLNPATLSALSDEVRSNLVSLYARVPSESIAAGSLWYLHARDIADAMARRHRTTLDVSAAIVAVTSPRCSWDENLARTEAVLGGTIPPMFDDIERKCSSILADPGRTERYVKGPKVSAFRRAILGDMSAVVLDIWALRAALATPYVSDADYKLGVGTATRYGIVAEGFRRAAEDVGLHPAILQAILWVAVRDHGVLDPTGEPVEDPM
jgi:hypothetical protein